MEMAADTIGFMAAGIVILAFLWHLRMEIRDLRQDMHRNIGSARWETGAFRQDMNRNIGALRRDLNRNIGALRRDMNAVRDGLSRVESMLAGASLKRQF